MANTQILPLGVANTPADYTIDSTLEVTVGSIFANYDGTAAAGSFVPTVEIISDSGHTIIEVPQDTTIAAGGTVKASWAPFLKTVAAAAPSAGALPWALLYTGAASRPYPYLGGDDVPFASTAAHQDSGGVFTFGTNATYPNNNKTLSVTQTGLYLVHVQVAWESWPIATPVQIRFFPRTYQGDNNYNRDSELITANDQGVMGYVTTLSIDLVPFRIYPIACQSSGVNQWLDGNFMKVIQLSRL